MSVLECKNCLNIRIYFEYLYNFRYKYLFGHLFVSDLLYEYNRICVRVNLLVQIYLDNGYSFVSYFLRMSHSGMQAKSCIQLRQAQWAYLNWVSYLSKAMDENGLACN